MVDETTGIKIKRAAEELFIQKGYEATKMRDIAEQAGVNLALINYYFKSKKTLFLIIMGEKIRKLFDHIIPVITDDSLPMHEKIDMMVKEYIEIISADQNLPIFIFSELQKQDNIFTGAIPFEKIKDSSFIRQIREQQPDINPLHYIINILGMAFFPFIVGPTMVRVGFISEQELSELITERTKFVPVWSTAVIHTKIQQ